MIRLTDPNLEEKIARVEGEDWRKHHAAWERHADQSCTIAGARAALAKAKDERLFSATIYGNGGYHRYHVQGNEVRFSVHHAGYSANACAQALLAGFALTAAEWLRSKVAVLTSDKRLFLDNASPWEFEAAAQLEPGSDAWLLLFDKEWYYGVAYNSGASRYLRVYGPVATYMELS
jgi:hypothetical protein